MPDLLIFRTLSRYESLGGWACPPRWGGPTVLPRPRCPT